MKKKHIIFFLLFVTIKTSCAQIFTIDTTGSFNDPVYLIPNYLAGNGVTITNETWYGSPCQFGKFTDGLNYMGIDSGIIMTTGRVSQVSASWSFTFPYSTYAYPPSWMTPGVNGYFYIPNSLITGVTNDLVQSANYSYSTLTSSYNVYNLPFANIDTSYVNVALLEFDIIPSSDTLSIEFSYVSNRWGGWFMGSNNGGPILPDSHDPFLILASGTGINGSYSSPLTYPNGSQNFAWVPNRTPSLPITNCTLHGATFSPNMGQPSESHNTNPPGLGPPWYSSSSTFNFSGYSDQIRSNLPTIPCENYHIKILIASNYNFQVGGTIVDSGVMLKAKSLSSEAKLTLVPESDFTLGFDTALVEGCGQTTIHFIRNSNVALSDTVHFTVLGTATNGVDYSFLPDSIVFPAGDDSFAITFTIPNDFVTEGVESLIFDVIDSSFYLPCGLVTVNLLELTISDQPPFTSTVQNTIVNCTDTAAYVSVAVTSGMPLYSYLWSTGDTFTIDTLQPAPISDSLLFVTITDGCGNQKIDSAFIDVQNTPLDVTPINGHVFCNDDSTQIGVHVNSGYPPITFNWFNGSTDSTTTVTVPFNSTYSVTVTDVCNRDTILSVSATVLPYAPLTTSPIPIDSFWCAPHIIQVSNPVISGGSGNFITSFTNWTDSLNWFFAITNNDTNVVLQIVDLCSPDTLQVNYAYEYAQTGPFTVHLPRDTTICQGDSVKLIAKATGGYPPYSYLWENGNTASYRWVNIAGIQHYAVSVTDGCAIEIVKNITVHPKYITAKFESSTPEPLTVQLSNQSTGADYYLWNFGDGNSSSNENPVHEYQIWDDYTISLFVEDTLGCIDSTSAYISLPLNVYLPNAFSPNSDSDNPVFEIIGVWNENLLQLFSIDIYDRWGGLVFSSENIHFKWNGTANGVPVMIGVYSYVVKIKFENHTLESLSGTVTVVK